MREGRTHVPRRPVEECEPSLCRWRQPVAGLRASLLSVYFDSKWRERLTPHPVAGNGLSALAAVASVAARMHGARCGSLCRGAASWEVTALFLQPTLSTDSYAHPTLSVLANAVLVSVPGRSIVAFGWLAFGWYLAGL